MTTIQMMGQGDTVMPWRGDRIDIALRWLLLGLAGAYGMAAGSFALGDWNATIGIFGALAAWTIVASVIWFAAPAHARAPWLYLVDVIGFAGLAATAVEQPSAYETLALVPLIVASLHLRRRELWPASMLAAAVALLISFGHADRDIATGAARVLTFVAVPWLAHRLAERFRAEYQPRLSIVQQALHETPLPAPLASEPALPAQPAGEPALSVELVIGTSNVSPPAPAPVVPPEPAALPIARPRPASSAPEPATERMGSLYAAATIVAGTSNTTGLDALFGECAKLVPFRACAVLVPTNVRDEFKITASRNLAPTEAHARLTVGQLGTLGQLFRGPNSILLTEAAKRELSALPSITGCRSVMLLPLRSGQRFVGALLLGTDVERFTAEQMDVLSTIAGYTMFAVQNLRLRNDLQDTRTGMMDRERDMRRQLNRDLHDGPAQALAAITLNLEFIKRLQQYEPARVQEELQKVIDMARRANHDVRTLLFELRSVTLETQGLVAAFQHYFERYADHPAKIVLEHGDVSMLDRNVQSTFLSLTQEAVNNAIKHAQATTIRVRVSHTVDQAMLRIEDDGIGFDLAAIRANYETRGSFGLLNIEERARLVNGTAELRSAPGHGTSIEVRVPLN